MGQKGQQTSFWGIYEILTFKFFFGLDYYTYLVKQFIVSNTLQYRFIPTYPTFVKLYTTGKKYKLDKWEKVILQKQQLLIRAWVRCWIEINQEINSVRTFCIYDVI